MRFVGVKTEDEQASAMVFRAQLDREITLRAKRDERARRIMTIPGIGPVTAVAITALAAPPETSRKGGCCRFHGHRVKVFKVRSEVGDGRQEAANIFQRVQA